MECESDDDGFSFEVGQRVEVLWEDEWYSGEILEELDDGFYKVDVDYDDEEWHHTTDDIRPGVSRQEWLQNDLADVERRYTSVIEVEINFDSDWESESDDDGFSFEVEVWDEDGWSSQEDAPIEEPSESESDGEDWDDDEPKFEDEEFPACDQSVGYPTGDTASGISANEVEKWTRLPELAQEVKLFGLIESNDVIQGAIGNCW